MRKTFHISTQFSGGMWYVIYKYSNEPVMYLGNVRWDPHIEDTKFWKKQVDFT